MLRHVQNQFRARREFIAAMRPDTGLFTAVLTLASFGLYNVSWVFSTIAAFAVAGITMSAMVWNDIMDRHHDVQKGKIFAQDHARELLMFWMRFSAITFGVLVVVGMEDLRLAVFYGTLWMVGIWYAATYRWCLAPNLTVATCVASLVLAPSLHFHKLNLRIAIIFLIVFSTILMREVVKDIGDQAWDGGYKATMPVKWGHLRTMMFLIGFSLVPMAFLLAYPHWLVKCVACFIAPVQFVNGLMFFRPQMFTRSLVTIDVFLGALLMALLIAR